MHHGLGFRPEGHARQTMGQHDQQADGQPRQQVRHQRRSIGGNPVAEGNAAQQQRRENSKAPSRQPRLLAPPRVHDLDQHDRDRDADQRVVQHQAADQEPVDPGQPAIGNVLAGIRPVGVKEALHHQPLFDDAVRQSQHQQRRPALVPPRHDLAHKDRAAAVEAEVQQK